MSLRARHAKKMPLCVGRQKGDDVEVVDLRPEKEPASADLRAEVHAQLRDADSAYVEIMSIVSEAIVAARKAELAQERWIEHRMSTARVKAADDVADTAYQRVCLAVLWALHEREGSDFANHPGKIARYSEDQNFDTLDSEDRSD